MMEDIKKALLVGVGSTAIALEKAVEQVDKLVSRGKLTVAEGKKLTEELIQRKNKEVSMEEKETLEAILLEMNVAQRKDIEDLEAKVEELERKLTDKSTEV
jgi:polyhydroxyalkanoate synthesis regulator phasin